MKDTETYVLEIEKLRDNLSPEQIKELQNNLKINKISKTPKQRNIYTHLDIKCIRQASRTLNQVTHTYLTENQRGFFIKTQFTTPEAHNQSANTK